MKKSFLFVFIFICVVFVNSQTPFQFCFKQMNYTGSGLTTPRGITSADFNGDGKVDLAATNQGANNISILFGIGTGSFSTIVNYGVGNSPWGITSADFNGDGKADLAIANWGGTDISVLLGTGTGSFASALSFTVGYNTREIISADFNGDGKADLATTYFFGTDVSILLGTGTGSFATAVNYSVGSSPWGLTSNDFNGDGKLDLATANWGSNNVSILLGTGIGTFSTVTNYSVGNSPQGITSGDFNGDFKPDLAVTNYGPLGGGNVAILLGTGNGNFGTATHCSSGTNPGGITCSDLTGDGNLDLAVIDFGGSMIYFLEGNGAGIFTWAKNFAFASGSQIIAKDINGDGKSDLVSTAYSMNTIPILLNAEPPSLTISSNPSNLCVGEPMTLSASGAYQYAWSANGVITPTIYTSNNSTVFIANTTSTYVVMGISAMTSCTANAIAQVSISACTGEIATNERQDQFSIFPNPAKSNITFYIPFGEHITIFIYNLVGQLILQCENSTDLHSIDISDLNEGFYLYKIVTKNKLYSGKFWKIID